LRQPLKPCLATGTRLDVRQDPVVFRGIKLALKELQQNTIGETCIHDGSPEMIGASASWRAVKVRQRGYADSGRTLQHFFAIFIFFRVCGADGGFSPVPAVVAVQISRGIVFPARRKSEGVRHEAF
jgi:hypothetical protein